MARIILAPLRLICACEARPPSACLRRSVSSLRSWPAENTGPSAAKTTARTASSPSAASIAACSAASMASDRLLRRSGRVKVRRSTRPTRSLRSSRAALAAGGGGRAAVLGAGIVKPTLSPRSQQTSLSPSSRVQGLGLTLPALLQDRVDLVVVLGHDLDIGRKLDRGRRLQRIIEFIEHLLLFLVGDRLVGGDLFDLLLDGDLRFGEGFGLRVDAGHHHGNGEIG